jgi:hypothetical protein
VQCNIRETEFGKVALNNSEKHLTYRADEFRGERLWVEELNWDIMKESVSHINIKNC